MHFIDLQAQRRRLGSAIDDAMARVLAHGQFILGPEVGELEAALSSYTGARHSIACGNGTDALALVLMAWGIRPGDAVFVPALTFVATAEVVAWLGATPVFVDVEEDTFNIDPQRLEAAIGASRAAGLRPAAVIPVDLYGQPANYTAVAALAQAAGLKVLADAAQSFGASLDGRRVGTFGDATATSFFPSKPLSCYGDGGAIFTDDDELAAALRALRVHGRGTAEGDHDRIGMNGRLDTLQAAVLLQKLTIFDDELAARRRIAARYNSALGNVVGVPATRPGATSAWAVYTIRCQDRDAVRAACEKAGVPTRIYYELPVPRQSGYARFPAGPGGTPVADRLSETIVSLPMHPYLDEAAQDRVVEAVRMGALKHT